MAEEVYRFLAASAAARLTRSANLFAVLFTLRDVWTERSTQDFLQSLYSFRGKPHVRIYYIFS
jgi:hypothetical protein